MATMYSREDFKIESVGDFLSFAVVAPFIGLVTPFLLAAYTIGFILDLCGWYET